MSIIAFAVVSFVLVYTFLNFQFRKPEPGMFPYEEHQRREAGPFAGPDAWTTLPPPEAAPLPEGADARIDYRPFESGIPPEFRPHIPRDTVFPARVAALRLLPDGFAVDLEWPDNAAPPAALALHARGPALLLLPDDAAPRAAGRRTTHRHRADPAAAPRTVTLPTLVGAASWPERAGGP